MLRLLLAGQGPIAQASPELVTLLGFAPDRPQPPAREFDRLIRDYLRYDTSFGGTVVDEVQSGDPLRVDAALRTFSTSFHGYLESKGLRMRQAGRFDAQARGWLWKGANVAVYVNAVALANAAAYANVGVATNAVATLVVAWFYLPDYNSVNNAFERDELIASVASFLD